MKKFAIVLSGCGQHDGSETHEVILTLLSLGQEKISWEAFSPDIKHHRIINHVTGKQEVTNMPRSVMEESARLVRGKIKSLEDAKASDFDAIIFPGGFGAVSVLCDWAERGKDFSFNSHVKSFIDGAVDLQKPMGFICIAPIMITKIYKFASFTIGNDKKLSTLIGEMGGCHVDCPADDVVVDEKNKVVSTPANMVANGIDEVYIGIHKLVRELSNLS